MEKQNLIHKSIQNGCFGSKKNISQQSRQRAVNKKTGAGPYGDPQGGSAKVTERAADMSQGGSGRVRDRAADVSQGGSGEVHEKNRRTLWTPAHYRVTEARVINAGNGERIKVPNRVQGTHALHAVEATFSTIVWTSRQLYQGDNNMIVLGLDSNPEMCGASESVVEDPKGPQTSPKHSNITSMVTDFDGRWFYVLATTVDSAVTVFARASLCLLCIHEITDSHNLLLITPRGNLSHPVIAAHHYYPRTVDSSRPLILSHQSRHISTTLEQLILSTL